MAKKNLVEKEEPEEEEEEEEEETSVSPDSYNPHFVGDSK